MDLNNPQIVQFTNKAEVTAEIIIKHSRVILPTLGRLFLIGTFLEDGFRMWFQWSDQRDYISYHWDLPMFLGTLFVIYNLFAQLGGSSMVLFRKNVRIACGILLSVVLIQTVAYNVLWTPNFFFRNLSLVGGLALLFTETFESGRKSLFAGVPSLDNHDNHVNYLQLFGRVTLVFMFLTIQRWELSFFYLIETALACALMFAVTIGWKTKLSALALAVYLFFMNLWINAFWMLDYQSSHRDLYKYDFFQTLSIIGGLLLLISLGPVLAKAADTKSSPAAVTGVGGLCLESQPDGFALLQDTSNGNEILVIFKSTDIWLVDVNQFTENLLHGGQTEILGAKNYIDATKIWPAYPAGRKRVISFSGLPNNTDPFYNDVLVFFKDTLLRYKVQRLFQDRGTQEFKMKVNLMGRHSLAHWPRFVTNVNDIQLMYIARGTKVLYTRMYELFMGRIDSLHALSTENLNYPVSLSMLRIYRKFRSDTHHFQMLSDGKTAITFLETGNVCINSTCADVKKILKCDEIVFEFAHSFAYWLYSQTELTIRLLIISLLSLMIINYALAVAFIFNQLNRVNDLS